MTDPEHLLEELKETNQYWKIGVVEELVRYTRELESKWLNQEQEILRMIANVSLLSVRSTSLLADLEKGQNRSNEDTPATRRLLTIFSHS